MLNQVNRLLHLLLCLSVLFLNLPIPSALAQYKPPLSPTEQDQLDWSNRLKEVDQLIYQATQQGSIRVSILLRGIPFQATSAATIYEENEVYKLYAREVLENFLRKYEGLQSKVVRDLGDLWLILELDAKSLAMIKYDRSVVVIQGRRILDDRGEVDTRFRPSPSQP